MIKLGSGKRKQFEEFIDWDRVLLASDPATPCSSGSAPSSPVCSSSLMYTAVPNAPCALMPIPLTSLCYWNPVLFINPCHSFQPGTAAVSHLNTCIHINGNKDITSNHMSQVSDLKRDVLTAKRPRTVSTKRACPWDGMAIKQHPDCKEMLLFIRKWLLYKKKKIDTLPPFPQTTVNLDTQSTDLIAFEDDILVSDPVLLDHLKNK